MSIKSCLHGWTAYLNAKEFTEWKYVQTRQHLQTGWSLFMQACPINKTYF